MEENGEEKGREWGRREGGRGKKKNQIVRGHAVVKYLPVNQIPANPRFFHSGPVLTQCHPLWKSIAIINYQLLLFTLKSKTHFLEEDLITDAAFFIKQMVWLASHQIVSVIKWKESWGQKI